METITLREAAQRVIRDPSNEDSIGWNEHFAEALGHQIYDLDWDKIEARMKCYWLHRWYCGDSYVGVRVYYFDDKPLVVSIQTGRKMREEFEFLDRDTALEARAFMSSCAPEPEFPMLDETKKIALLNPVNYTTQLLDYEGVVDGQPVTLDRMNQDRSYRAGVPDTVKMPDGTSRPIKDFLIPLKVSPSA